MFFFNSLIEFFKAHPVLVSINMCFMLLMPINEVLLPHLYGKLVDSVQTQKGFIKYFIIVISVILIVQFLSTIGDWHDTLLNPEFQKFIRNNMLSKILDKYENNYEEITTGDLITKFVKTPSIFTQWFSRFKDYIIPYTLVFFSAAGYFLYYDKLLGITLIVTITLMIYLLLTSPYHCKEYTIEKSRLYSNIHENIDDILRNLLSVYTAKQQENELKHIRSLEDQYKTAFMNTMLCILKYKIISVPIVVTFFAIFIYRCNTLIREKKMKPSNFVSLFMIILYLIGSFMWLIDIMRDVIFDWGMIKETEKHLEIPPPVVNSKINDLTSSVPPGIGLYNVTFKYKESKEPILENISLQFEEGKKTVLLGEIGSGKSTILKLLMKFNSPNSGDLYINNKWYSQLHSYYVRQEIGYVPQQPILFNRSVIDNIKYGNPNIKDEQIIKLLKDLDIYDEFSKLDGGLYSPIGKNGSRLSGGQRQLLWCLRILLINPKVLILDEPTSAMDNKTKDLLFRILDIVMKDKTVIMVTHDPYLLQKVDTKIYMSHGKIVNIEKRNNGYGSYY